MPKRQRTSRTIELKGLVIWDRGCVTVRPWRDGLWAITKDAVVDRYRVARNGRKSMRRLSNLSSSVLLM